METYAVSTTGESLWVEDDAGKMVEVGEVKSAPGLTRTPQKLDATHLKCSVMAYVDGIPDLGSELQWTTNLVPRGKPNSNIEFLNKLSRTKKRKLWIKMPQAGYLVVLQGQVTCGINPRSVNGVLELTVSLTPNSDYSLIPLEETYVVTYDANGGTGEVTDEEDYEPGAEVTVKAATGLTNTGSQFMNWNTAKDGTGRSYMAGETFTIYEDTTLYAIWLSTQSVQQQNSIESDSDGVDA